MLLGLHGGVVLHASEVGRIFDYSSVYNILLVALEHASLLLVIHFIWGLGTHHGLRRLGQMAVRLRLLERRLPDMLDLLSSGLHVTRWIVISARLLTAGSE